ncbi:MAG: cellulase, partial [Chitinophagaceae bacterium]
MLGKKGKKKSVYAIVALAGSVLLGLCFSFAPRNLQPPDGVPEIRVNQVGYFPGGPKLAVVTGDNAVADFYILGKNLDTVYHGRLADKKKSGWSSLDTRLADFSSINNPGRYTLVVAGDHPSYPFEIRDDIYREVGRVVLKGFYFQRSDQSLTVKYAGEWARAAGHPDTSVLVHPSAAGAARPAGTKISSAGGWYDAGDYNKYIVNSGITMGTLLSAYEDFPEYYRSLETGIPESGNGIPDLLDETLYNLRWM